MTSIAAIALSGMNAATLRLAASASNIANANSSGPLPGAPNPTNQPPAYTPLQINQTALAGGGALAALSPSSAGVIQTYSPDAPYADGQGLIATPDVDLAGEMVQLITARYAFAANLQVARTDADMSADMLGVIA